MKRPISRKSAYRKYRRDMLKDPATSIIILDEHIDYNLLWAEQICDENGKYLFDAHELKAIISLAVEYLKQIKEAQNDQRRTNPADRSGAKRIQ